MKELETVVLTRSIPEYGLVAGDLGAIVAVYDEGKAFEVEFIESDGRTIAVLTLDACDVRARKSGEILHARQLSG
ncbi:MAG: DUF4926 domain-containing protein [Planctomycetaceae bacterium]|nr:DUF4926 domain-containing protein [Planctomycetaceae bacterium]